MNRSPEILRGEMDADLRRWGTGRVERYVSFPALSAIAALTAFLLWSAASLARPTAVGTESVLKADSRT